MSENQRKKLECQVCHKSVCNINRHMKEVHKVGLLSFATKEEELEYLYDLYESTEGSMTPKDAMRLAVLQGFTSSSSSSSAAKKRPATATSSSGSDDGAEIDEKTVATSAAAAAAPSAATADFSRFAYIHSDAIAAIEYIKPPSDTGSEIKKFKSEGKQCPYCLKFFQRVNRHIRDNCAGSSSSKPASTPTTSSTSLVKSSSKSPATLNPASVSASTANQGTNTTVAVAGKASPFVPPSGYEYFDANIPDLEFYGNPDEYCDQIRQLIEDIGYENGGVVEGIKIPKKDKQTDMWCIALKRPLMLQLYNLSTNSPPLLVAKSTIALADNLALKVNRMNCDMHDPRKMAPVFSYMRDLLKICRESPNSPSKQAFNLVLGFEMACSHYFLQDYKMVQSFTGNTTLIVDAFSDFISALIAYVLLNTKTEGLSDIERQSYELSLSLRQYFSSDTGIAEKHTNRIKALTEDYKERKEQPNKAPASLEITSLAEVLSAYEVLINEHGEVLPKGGDISRKKAKM